MFDFEAKKLLLSTFKIKEPTKKRDTNVDIDPSQDNTTATNAHILMPQPVKTDFFRLYKIYVYHVQIFTKQMIDWSFMIVENRAS